jgi:hypothetical protein
MVCHKWIMSVFQLMSERRKIAGSNVIFIIFGLVDVVSRALIGNHISSNHGGID